MAAVGGGEGVGQRSSKLDLLVVSVCGPEPASFARSEVKVVTLGGLAIFGGLRVRIARIYGLLPKVVSRLVRKGGHLGLAIFGGVV